MGDVSIDTVISHVDMGYIVTLVGAPPSSASTPARVYPSSIPSSTSVRTSTSFPQCLATINQSFKVDAAACNAATTSASHGSLVDYANARRVM